MSLSHRKEFRDQLLRTAAFRAPCEPVARQASGGPVAALREEGRGAPPVSHPRVPAACVPLRPPSLSVLPPLMGAERALHATDLLEVPGSPACCAPAWPTSRQVAHGTGARPSAFVPLPWPQADTPGRTVCARADGAPGPSSGSEGDSEASPVPSGLLLEPPLGLTAAAGPITWAVAGTAVRDTGPPCLDKALSSASSTGGCQCLCLQTGFPGAASLCPCQSHQNPGGTSSCGHLLQQNQGCAKGHPRRGSASLACQQPAQVHYRGRNLRRKENHRTFTRSSSSS